MKKFTKHPITASSNYPKVPAGWAIIPEGNDEDGNWTTLSKTLPNDEGYIWLDMQYDDNDRRYYELSIGYRQKSGRIGPIMSLASGKEFYRLGDAVKYAEQYCNRVTSCSSIEATDDFSQLALPDYKYSVEGYYDSNFQGLVDSYTGDDFSEALSAAHEFACDGDFIIIKNVQTGRTRSYSTDDWFNAIAYGDYPADVYKIQ